MEQEGSLLERHGRGWRQLLEEQRLQFNYERQRRIVRAALACCMEKPTTHAGWVLEYPFFKAESTKVTPDKNPSPNGCRDANGVECDDDRKDENSQNSVWVQCSVCETWRLLPAGVSANDLPEAQPHSCLSCFLRRVDSDGELIFSCARRRYGTARYHPCVSSARSRRSHRRV